MRRYTTIRRRGLGWPVFPDQFNTASGANFAFSPQTPDAIVMAILQQQNQQLPADLVAKWAAAGHTSTLPAPAPVAPPPIPVATAPAVNPSGQPVSMQTGAGLRLVDILNIAPGIYRCLMSDGSSHYCDVDGNPITYTPPTPAVTPAAGSTAVIPVSASVAQAAALPAGASAVSSSQPLYLAPALQAPGATATAPPPSVAVTPAGTPISTVTATPAAPAAASSGFDLSSIMTWLQGSLFGGIPNWLLAGGVALLVFSGEDSQPRRSRR